MNWLPHGVDRQLHTIATTRVPFDPDYREYREYQSSLTCWRRVTTLDIGEDWLRESHTIPEPDARRRRRAETEPKNDDDKHPRKKR